MPSSRASTIPYVIHAMKQLRPSSILDVGVGFGKWGYLFREFTDIVQSEHDSTRYIKPGWKIRIEGIEGFKEYLHPGHEFIYDRVHIGMVQEVLPRLGTYDVIFFGDIIEHLTLEEGQAVLRQALSRARKAVIVTTPRYDTGQDSLCGNMLEIHRSLWNNEDFAAVGKCKVVLADRDTLVSLFPCSEAAWNVTLGPERPLARSRWIEVMRAGSIRVHTLIKRAVKQSAS